MKRRYILLLSALVLFTDAVIMTGCPAHVQPQTQKYKVTLKSGKHGTVTVNPALPEDGMVEAHTRLSFTAQPDEGYEVDTWTGVDHNYRGNTTATLTIMADTTVSVTFNRIGYSSEKQKYKVTLVQPEHGTVTVKPALSEDGMIPQYTNLTFTVTPEPGWQVNKWTGAKIWQDKIGYDVENNEVHLSVTEDVTVSVTMIEEGKADASLLIIDSTGRLTGVTDKYRLKGSLVLPETVTAIGSEALADCTGLTSVIIPDSVTSIGYKAFYRCTGLTGVTIGNNVTEIDEGAFSGCYNLMSITIPDSVTTIGSDSHSFFSGGAFHDCKSLTNVTIGKGMTKIGYSAFDGCNKIKTLNINCKTVPYLGMTSLKELTLGDNVNAIGERAFYSCTDLTNITIPDSVTKIGNEAFQGCTGLTDVIIPDSVTEIGKAAFKDCSNIISLGIGKGLTSIYLGDYHYESPFDGCNKIEKLNINSKTVPRLNIKSLKEATLGEQVTEISDGAFSYCEGLTTITIPHNVTKIGERAFKNCTHLTNVTIPNNVTKIGDEAFESCIGLTDVIIPDNVTEIGASAFASCTKLATVNIGNNVTMIGNNAFSGCTGLTSVTIPDSVTKIGYAVFENCTGLTSITIPDSVTKIGSEAFKSCSGLTSITIPDSVTTIGSDSSSFFRGGAFENCYSLTSVTIGKGVTKIGYSAFSGCNKIKTLNINCKTVPYLGMTSLKELTLGDNVNEIEREAFQGCTGLTNITIGSGVTEIGREAFRGCTGLTDVIIPDSVTEIGKSAFKDCSNIISLTIGKGLTTIHLGDTDYLGDNQKTPFNGCNQIEKLDINCSITPRLDITSLKEIIIGDNVTTISDNAFSGCTGLTTLTIPDNVTKIGERAFNNCSGLITVTIGKGLEHYYYSSFDGCNNVKTLNINCRDAVDFGFSQTLTELNLGDNVTRIRGYAFSECSHLTNITIPESVAFIGVHAFDKCSNLTTAIFKSKASWKLEYEYNGDHINIQEELENPSTAAQYLKYQYTHFSWTKN